MPITLLDIILLTVMLISGILAMIRGFIREILSITAWVVAALATLLLFGRLVPHAEAYFNNEVVAKAVVAAGVFLGTLMVVTIITVRLSDIILDSRIGALDRTLGLLFGLVRGLLIVVVAFLFFDWLVPEKSQPNWISGAKSRVILAGTGNWLKSMLPDDPESTILKRLKKPGGDQTPAGAPAPDSDVPPADGGDKEGYERTERNNMQQLIETETKPAPAR